MNDSSTSRSILAIASAALIAAACSASASQPVLENEPASTDDSGAAEEQSAARKRPAKQSSTADAATEQAQSSDAGACDPIDDISEWVLPSSSTSEPPEPEGGSISPGTYILTSQITYGANAPSKNTRGTIRFENGINDYSYESSSSVAHVSYSYATSGTRITNTLLCTDRPDIFKDEETFSNYTATATQFIAFSLNAQDITTAKTFTKQ